MDSITANLLLVGAALLLVLINGFFVAAEFALVKVRQTKIDAFVAQKRAFAKIVRSQLRRLDAALSACQLGITLASLGLGWVGEPALAKLIHPLLLRAGIQSEVALHAAAFAVGFSIITALHLTIGEQVPKMYAVKNPERVALWCAMPLKMFYTMAYPFLIALNSTSNFMLRRLGISDTNEHGEPHSEDEIRALLAQSHSHGELTRTEHRLLNAVFEFDDCVVREIMIPRRELIYFEEGKSLEDYLNLVKTVKHTRFPFCKTSLDDIIGVVHIKDLIGVSAESNFDIHEIVRPLHKIPEALSVGKVLRLFQSTKQHMAAVVDEYGNVIGAVTLENIIEEIVGSVQDEFDLEDPKIVPAGSGAFLVDGGISVSALSRDLTLAFDIGEAETLSGLITEELGRLPKVGDCIEFAEFNAEVVEIIDGLAKRVKITLNRSDLND